MDDDEKFELANLRLHTQADVQRLWELLLRPIEVDSYSLWVALVDDREMPVPLLMEITGNEAPTEGEVSNLFLTLQQVCEEQGEIGSVAFLITRPGSEGPTDGDRKLTTRLLAGASAQGVPCQPVHLANDVRIVVVTPDDLAA